jgi:hypothetical protein
MKRSISLAAAVSATLVATAVTVCLAVPAGAVARPAASGTENFQFMTTSATSNPYSVIASGVFTAAGVDHTSGSKPGTVVFPTGTFKVEQSGSTAIGVSPTTCLESGSGSGTITLSDGTGAYKEISGKGSLHLTILGIAAKSGGKCSTTKQVAWQEVIKASAQVSL